MAKTLLDHLENDPERLTTPLKEINEADGKNDRIDYIIKAIKYAAGN